MALDIPASIDWHKTSIMSCYGTVWVLLFTLKIKSDIAFGGITFVLRRSVSAEKDKWTLAQL
ncbi:MULTISPECIES: hypothetical protein [Parageobacillus]|uniref:Uncharacterized protein n=1 Tax=Parageobacillus thermoglucosidasius TaxID=1426 RepID=A0A1B7KRY4_PARTM|nr:MULTISPECIES: hypothetical protein [Parageobacillus]OAT72851.1 hypothetical protein A7K69_07910 [Parageobacillus thermoglucosidasius]BDG47134.1 hypothetical protein PspKH34_16950 [Parageobacillus sp. KH3-4]